MTEELKKLVLEKEEEIKKMAEKLAKMENSLYDVTTISPRLM